MPREDTSTIQFLWCSIWTPGYSNEILERSKMRFPLILTMCSNSQRITHLIAKIRHLELQILNSWENLRISFDKTCAELSSMQMMRAVFTRGAVVNSPAGVVHAN